MNEHLAEFMASSVLTAVMTYANWGLSAEMRLFSKKKKRRYMYNQYWMKGGGKHALKDNLCTRDVCVHLLNAYYHGA